jgi:hypothetical protein
MGLGATRPRSASLSKSSAPPEGAKSCREATPFGLLENKKGYRLTFSEAKVLARALSRPIGRAAW